MSEKKYCYAYPRPALTTDCVLFGYEPNVIKILLIERGQEPYKGQWALPGGFVNENETTDEAVHREVEEETNLTGLPLFQLKTYSEPNRDPRHRTVSVAYSGLVKLRNYDPKAGDDAANSKWFSLSELPPLAFDHDVIVADGLNYLKEKLKNSVLKDTHFSTDDLQDIKTLLRTQV